MRLRHLKVRNFRGISQLDWLIAGNFLCLVGPGDSCKSTILDAVELALFSRWNPQLDDSDFFRGDASVPIEIEVTVDELPMELIRDSRFGLHQRGLRQSGEFTLEPEEDSDDPAEPVTTIRFELRDDLEPRWEVVRGDGEEGVPVHVRDRQRLGAVRVGAYVDRHLTWSQGSILSTMSGDFDKHSGILAAASRSARSSVRHDSFKELGDAAKRAEGLAKGFGVRVGTGFSPVLDPAGLALNVGGLSLHDGHVPVRRLGLGSRRLVACALQHDVTSDAGVTLIDELEHGLEPHRIRRLLKVLRRAHDPANGEPATESSSPRDVADETTATSKPGVARPLTRGLTLLTTHSSVVVAELEPENLCVVRRLADGTTSVRIVDSTLRRELRKHPEAFLGRRVIICEGITELGLCRGLDGAGFFPSSFATQGVVLVDGGGRTEVGKRALMFAALGYGACVFADSDQPLDVSSDELLRSGIEPFVWPGERCTEEALFDAMPLKAIEVVLDGVRDRLDGINFVERMTSIGGLRRELGVSSLEDLNGGPNERPIRAALGKAANKGGWFKKVPFAEPLGEAIVGDFVGVPAGSALRLVLESLRAWVERE